MVTFCHLKLKKKMVLILLSNSIMFILNWFLANLSWKLKWAFLITLVRRLSVRPSIRLSVCKLFTFSSYSSEPRGQFQPNLAQSIPEWRGFKFVQMNGPALFQREIIINLRKYIDEIKKNLFSRTTEPISTNLCTKHPWVRGIQVSSNEKNNKFS